MLRPSFEKAAVAAPGGYPEVGPHQANRRTARLLMQDVSYSKGELTAIHQYLYQHWMLAKTQPHIAGTLLRIAEVEMKHLDLLGELIRSMGGDPRFCSVQQNGGSWWNGGLVRYGGSLRQMLGWDIAAERDSADLYESQARYVHDENASAILSRLAADERVHHQLLREILEQES